MTCASTSYGEGEVQARLGSESAGTNTGTARGLEQSNACREIERGSNSRTQSGVELLDRRTLGYTETLTSHGAGWGLEPVEPAERRRVEIACTRFLCATAYRAQALPSRRLVVSFLFSAVSLNRLAPSDVGAYTRESAERVCRESHPEGLRSHLRRKGSAPFGVRKRGSSRRTVRAARRNAPTPVSQRTFVFQASRRKEAQWRRQAPVPTLA